MTDTNLGKIELLNLNAAYATTIACEKSIECLGKQKQDLRKKLFSLIET